MPNLTIDQLMLRDKAIAFALAAGFKYHENSRDPSRMCAPRGKFAGEPFYVMYYWDRVMNGDHDEPFYCSTGEFAADVLEVSDDERAAFDLDPGTAFILLWQSDAGFVSLDQITPREYDRYRARYDAEVRDE